MAAFFLKKKKEVTETVEEPQKTVEAAKKEAETVNTEPPATIVCPACGREINKKTVEKYKREARQLLKRIEHKKRTWFRRASVVAVSTAAVIAIIIGSVNFFRYMNEQQVTLAEVTTSFGEKRQVTLPDGTLLVLNSCSQVRYPERFVGDSREIELEGEGYFRVARNEKMPFIVKTKRLDVRVLGTRFDVKSYSTDEIVSVSVESGKVQVDLPEAMMRLTAKEQVLINTVSGEYSKKTEERPFTYVDGKQIWW